jgi:hypothetical protein
VLRLRSWAGLLWSQSINVGQQKVGGENTSQNPKQYHPQNQIGCSGQVFDVCIGTEYHAENDRNVDIEWQSIVDHGFSRCVALSQID